MEEWRERTRLLKIGGRKCGKSNVGSIEKEIGDGKKGFVSEWGDL